MVVVTDETFGAEVIQASQDKVVIVDFWADWCNPCKSLSPQLEELSRELLDVKFVSANIDDCGAKAGEYNIMSVPTLLFVLNGTVKHRVAGTTPAMAEKIHKILAEIVDTKE